MVTPINVISADGKWIAVPTDDTKPAESDLLYPDIEIRALKKYLNSLNVAIGGVTSYPQFLTNLTYPSQDGWWRDVYRSNWKPGWFNQVWGGAHVGTELLDGLTGDVYQFEPATGNIRGDSGSGISAAAGQYYISTGFKVPESAAYSAVWVKLTKAGNADRACTFAIYADNGSGSPGAAVTNGVANTINLKHISGKGGEGDWYRLAFATPPALIAGVQYHLVGTMGAVDASNYIIWVTTVRNNYPYGCQQLGTSGNVFTKFPAICPVFLIEPPTTNKFLQSGGQFDSKLVFMQSSGTPNQSKYLCQPAANYFDGKNGLILYRGNVPISSTFHDVLVGLDHDRLVVYTNASGAVCVTLYNYSGVVYTITGTTNVSSGNHDIAIGYRLLADGSDYIYLVVDGAVDCNPLAGQSFVMTKSWRDRATVLLGAGFPLAPVWTKSDVFSALPSTLGWTWTTSGSAVESSCMSILNSKLVQNRNGYPSATSGYYQRTGTGFNNATGWSVVLRNRVISSTNNSGIGRSTLIITDGSKYLAVIFNEYYTEFQYTAAGSADFCYQQDNRTKEHVYIISGKGSDFYVYCDGQLIVDGTGKLTFASGVTLLALGDSTTVAGEVADASYTYLKVYTGGMLLPTAANGAICNEYAVWSGDQQNALIPLYNLGTPIPVKKFCGCERNYIDGRDAGVTKYNLKSILQTYITSTSWVSMADMNHFCIGSEVEAQLVATLYPSVAAFPAAFITVDWNPQAQLQLSYMSSAGGNVNANAKIRLNINLGLHSVDTVWYTNTGTLSRLCTSGSPAAGSHLTSSAWV